MKKFLQYINKRIKRRKNRRFEITIPCSPDTIGKHLHMLTAMEEILGIECKTVKLQFCGWDWYPQEDFLQQIELQLDKLK